MIYSLRATAATIMSLLLLAPQLTQASSRGCVVDPKPIGNWSQFTKRYLYIIESKYPDGSRLYSVVETDRWNEQDDRLFEVVSRSQSKDFLMLGSGRAQVRPTSRSIVYGPKSPQLYDFSPRKGKKPGMAGPGRSEFENALANVCNQR